MVAKKKTDEKVKAFLVVLCLLLSFALYANAESSSAGVICDDADLLSDTEDQNETPAGFLFRGKITWGMSREKVRELEGEEKDQFEAGALTKLIYVDADTSKYRGFLSYTFFSDHLVCCTYEIEDAGQVMFRYLRKALDKEYSDEAETSLQELYDILKRLNPDGSKSSVSQNALVCKWQAPGDTDVYLTHEYHVTEIIYVSPDIFAEEEINTLT